MKFGDLFSKSWKELKSKRKVNSKIILYFIFIPGLISLIFSTLFGFTQSASLFAFTILVGIVAFFVGILAYTSLIYSTLFEKKDYSSSVFGGKKFYWRYLLWAIVFGIFILLLALALVIPAIIFGVYWMLSEYILIKENKGIIDSLRGSYKLIRNKWWTVFGYALLLTVISIGIGILFSIPSWPTGVMVFIDTAKNPDLYVKDAVPTTLSVVDYAISEFFSLLSNFVLLPLGIIFSKYLYLALKKKKRG